MDRKFLRHESCPDCGSKDNVGVWLDEQNKEQKYCFTCCEVKAGTSKKNYKADYPPYGASYWPIPWRKITQDTCIKYQVSSYGPIVYFPCVWDGKVVGVKDRDFNFHKGDKSCHMHVQGDYAHHMFGWQSVHTNKIIGIAYGEFDALAVFQATGIPCLSPSAGDGSLIRNLKADFSRIDQFEKIVLLPDLDHAGRAKQPSEYTDDVVKFLGEDRCFVAKLAFDDPNEYIMKGKVALLKQVFWAAESKAMELFHEKPSGLIAPTRMGILTGTPLDRSLGGLRSREVTYVMGAPSHGKTTFVLNLAFNFMQSGIKVGALVLEGAASKFITKLANIIANGDYYESPPEMQSIVNEVLDSQLFVSKLTGRTASIPEVERAVRAAVKAADCKVVVIDNLTGAADPDKFFESSSKLVLALDNLALTLDVHLVVVTHVGRGGYTDPPTLGSGVGTGHIERFAYNVVGIHRKGATTRIEVLKNREFGPTPHDIFHGDLSSGRYRFFNKAAVPVDMEDVLS